MFVCLQIGRTFATLALPPVFFDAGAAFLPAFLDIAFEVV
jgi:hypothetical protein